MRRWWRSRVASRRTTENLHGGTTVTALLQAPISGTVAVGSHIEQRVLNLGGVHGGVVTIIDGAVANPKGRLRPVLLRPVRPELILDRLSLREVARPTSAVRELELYGEAGSGKTTLLEELAWTVTDSDYPDGVVFLSLNSHQVNDSLYDIWCAFYECSTPFKPMDAQLRIDLSPICALVLLDDLDLEPAALHRIMHMLPNCRCIVASPERRLWGEGSSIHISGLPMEDAIPLIEHGIGRSLSSDECALAQALWHSTAGLPLRLQQSFAAVLEDAESRPGRDRAAGLLPSQTQRSDPVQAGLADAAALDQLANQLPAGMNLSSYVESQTDLWRASALAQLSLPDAEHGALADTSDQRLQLEQLLIEWGLRTGRYELALRLARSTEAALALRGHWDAWLRVLERVHSSALGVSDAQTQAWALHQIGSRALCLDQLAVADSALAASLEIRTRLGDESGAAVTWHNLQLADKAGRPSAGVRPRNWMALLAVSVVVAILAVGGVANAGQWWPFHPHAAHTVGALRSPSLSLSPSSTITSLSTTPPPTSSTTTSSAPQSSSPNKTPDPPTIHARPTILTFAGTTVGLSTPMRVYFTVTGTAHPTLSITPSQGVFNVDNGCANARSAHLTGSTCSVVVTFTPAAAGPATATLTAMLPNGSQSSVPLSGEGIAAPVTIELVNDSAKGYLPAGAVITGKNISCPKVCVVQVDVGAPVSLTAASCGEASCKDGVTFQGWKGPCSGSDLTCSFTASQPEAGGNLTVYYSYS
jgi:hypothetical protein